MADRDAIKRAILRGVEALKKRPGIGQHRYVTTARQCDGLLFEVTEGGWRLEAGFAAKGKEAMTPGFLVRAAYGSCLAVNLYNWSLQWDIDVADIAVDVHCDFDARGEMDLDGVSPAYSRVHYVVTLESDASEEDLKRLLDQALRTSTVAEIFRQPIACTGELAIRRPE